MESNPVYSRTHPFLARITDRYLLCQHGSEKRTFHVVLDITGSGISYAVGDSIAIQPTNIPDVVVKTLEAVHSDGKETIVDKHGNSFLLQDFLLTKVNLAEVPRKLIALLAERQTNLVKKERLDLLLAEGQKEILKEYQGAHEVWDAIEENEEAQLTPQELCLLLQPLLPRFYSIASSRYAVGEEVHLTVAEVEYETNGQLRRGIATHYLCCLAPLHDPVVPIYLQSSHGFTLPADDTVSVIMIGPGTGVAPYRGFMQERIATQARGKNWLFFGERYRKTEFFYEDYWSELISHGHLRLDTAFSRDQEHKLYVQHRLLEQGRELFEWLEQGAHLYVCGDAHRMAKDVDAAIHQIIQSHGSFDERTAKEYVKRLKAEKRYLRDIY
ncbi:MAG: sulfite reductase [Parachlamydiaceae bacterium]